VAEQPACTVYRFLSEDEEISPSRP
jgi:hypothetical protein